MNVKKSNQKKISWKIKNHRRLVDFGKSGRQKQRRSARSCKWYSGSGEPPNAGTSCGDDQLVPVLWFGGSGSICSYSKVRPSHGMTARRADRLPCFGSPCSGSADQNIQKTTPIWVSFSYGPGRTWTRDQAVMRTSAISKSCFSCEILWLSHSSAKEPLCTLT